MSMIEALEFRLQNAKAARDLAFSRFKEASAESKLWKQRWMEAVAQRNSQVSEVDLAALAVGRAHAAVRRNERKAEEALTNAIHELIQLAIDTYSGSLE